MFKNPYSTHFPIASLPHAGHLGPMKEIQTEVIKFLTQYGFQIIGAIIILAAG